MSHSDGGSPGDAPGGPAGGTEGDSPGASQRRACPLMTGREATAALRRAGLPERQARVVLASGLAGRPDRAGSAHLFDAHRVLALARRRVPTDEELAAAYPLGLFLARRVVPADASWDDQVAGLSREWAMSPFSAVMLKERVGRQGFLPLVGTTGGFVAVAAEIRAVVRIGSRTSDFRLEPPGRWANDLLETRLPAGPGPSWVFLGTGWSANRLVRPPRAG
ncbi:hypothetical protein [Nocardioides sp. Leaf307]|uniref:hypothetical protein n=1 Tax=Nocardioides sp. Leaf307 TaxID=1736331 RepID=UPI000702A41D|nr:hypothetical protein [Nocardioides sp. Leaf307]KQQ42825.1 hypothetical protein ASF50_01985 [Nocardioides sp. Leaf307]